MPQRWYSCAAVIAAAWAGVACQQSEPSAGSPETATLALAPAADKGSITLDGSSTVLPVSKAMAEAFQASQPKVRVSVGVSGTGGGFKKFCAGQLDITDASRPINQLEAEQCKQQGLEYIELPIGFDSLTVVVSAKNGFVDCLTVAELKRLWQPAAEGTLQRWNQVRASFPSEPLALFGPDQESGTFDYFTLAIVGAEGSSRSDFQKSSDDQAIARGVAADANALGYFGFANYLANKDQLKLLAVDSGKGCVAPSAQAVADGSYQPLSRPMFIYVSRAAAARPEVAAFTHFYLAPENAKWVEKFGYVPLPTVSLLAADSRFSRGVLGSALGGHGSVVGLRVDSFQNEERVQNALVR